MGSTKVRLTRAIQLGVLVGFVVVAPNYDPSDQHMETMRAMCAYFLHVSSV